MSIRVTTIIGLLSWPFDLVSICPFRVCSVGQGIAIEDMRGGGGDIR
jgi:hypothetical protein